MFRRLSSCTNLVLETFVLEWVFLVIPSYISFVGSLLISLSITVVREVIGS